MTFLHPERVHLMWIALLLAALLAVLDWRRRGAFRRFMSAVMQDRLATQVPRWRQLAAVVLAFAALGAGVFALMRPQSPGQVQTVQTRTSADIMVALDVSRSMLAEDAPPYRLARAKAEITDLVARLAGSRVGLVAFAGRAAVLCPLTTDYGFFRMILEGADTSSVSRGGTRLGAAVRTAVEAFPPGLGAKVILLITDGEDHDSYPVEAAREAAETGVRVIAIGYGSEEGSQITLVDPDTGARSVLTDSQGQVVTSRLDGDTLREMALVTEGLYVPARTGVLDLDAILRRHIQPLLKEARTEEEIRVMPREHYPWFVLASLLCVVGSAWASQAPRRQE